MWASSSIRALTNPSMRARRLATTAFFGATFAAAILTVSVSASTILPCPANSRSKTRGTLADTHTSSTPDSNESIPANGIGQRIHLTRKGGWIEIEHPTPNRALTNNKSAASPSQSTSSLSTSQHLPETPPSPSS